MKKFFALAAVSMAALTAFAYGELRIDLRCSGEMEISKVVAEGMNAKNIKKGFTLIMTPKLTNEWQKFEFTFTPDDDGRLSLAFQAPGSSNLKAIKPLLIDDVKVTGAVLKNGGFEKLNSKSEKSAEAPVAVKKDK